LTITWLPPPDWSQPLEERRRYRTEVLAGVDGNEQRRRLRARPRLGLSFQSQWMEVGEAIRLARGLDSLGAEWITLPWWPDTALVSSGVAVDATVVACDTLGRGFALGVEAALLTRGSTLYRALDVEAIGSGGLTVAAVPEAWPAGSEVVPLRRGRLLEAPQIAFLTDTTAALAVTLEAEA
jgi:hypothetical protein